MASDKLDKVALLADSRERQSAGQFKEKQQSLQSQQAQLQQLLQFKQEYETRLGNYSEKSIPARQLQDYRLFLGKLNQAIEQQQGIVSEAVLHVDDARQHWQDQAVHKSAMGQLLDKREHERQCAFERAEQLEADEKVLAKRVRDNS
ncbi:flagellar export protein FliJ [Porticoccus sp.]